MSYSEITQSRGAEIFSHSILEASSSGVNFTEYIPIHLFNTHSYHFVVSSNPSDPSPLNTSVSVQVTNDDPSEENNWVTIFYADVQGSGLETFHYKEIYNFAYTRVKLVGKGDFTVNESHTPIYRPHLKRYGVLYESCDFGIKYVKCSDIKKNV
tara:strand:- start:618 stop:1079 length:462 start_codon:yes stop_codon:yes gene_type:complete